MLSRVLPLYYKLDSHNVIPLGIGAEIGSPEWEAALLEWSKCFESTSRIVAQESICGAHVSTVFIGIDHQFGKGPPLVFETMVFGGEHDQFQERCSTWEEAEAMHRRAVSMVKHGVAADDT